MNNEPLNKNIKLTEKEKRDSENVIRAFMPLYIFISRVYSIGKN